MAADGAAAEGGEDFDPRSGDIEFHETHINSALTAPDQKLILAMCGDYYIGGRQFESLSDLIGYYTTCSCLLKNEQLIHPVAPQEPVDDRRRVVAMLSYRKAADSDELSFCKGDVFVVQNELEDGWLWVTSERTKESGLVPAPFVKDLDGDYEPVESLPYYHSCLSKEEAVEKLMQAGEGSFLVRQSENYPGDYSLFFLCEKDVRRFRIEKRGNQFLVGGRFFDSLDGVIKRYMKEEIVEGHTLRYPVYRDIFDSNNTRFERLTVDGSDDIYAPIRQSTGPKLVTRTNDRIEMSGYLHFRNEKMKKFKSYYFVLNGTEKILYFFENEKRSKPKGLIELEHTSVYPVHDSLFGRPNCFLLVSTYDNSKTTSYIGAESSEVIRRWVHILKSACSNMLAAMPAKGLRALHSLSVTVISAHHVPNKLLTHPACYLALNQHRVGRTQLYEGPDPFWNEEFQLDDIPPDVENFTVSLYNVKRTREMLIGSVTIQLSSLENQELADEHHPLAFLGGALPKGEVGTLRLKAYYQHQVLLPQAEYTSLKELLLEEGYENLLTLAQLCPKHEWTTLARALLRIFSSDRKEVVLLRTLNDHEIEKEVEVSTLFRATTLATTLMDQYMKMTSTDFVRQAVQSGVHKVLELKHSCELNPALLDGTTDSKANSELLLSLLNTIVEDIFRAADSCPSQLRYICNCLQRKARAKWPEDETVRTRVVSSFIFLRLLCPAIVNPKSFSLVAENPSETAARTLKLIAKVLQMLANLVDAGPKEPFMEVVHPFIRRNRERLVAFLDELAPTLRKLVAVTEVLTNHKKQYLGDT
ncbi:hypothetical protein C0Q70_20289 [Pomacea canaliculata]|uniref:Ras GTPase-activating protein 1 n=1 Tax=Pomacea canaliculata TaxID=400727 RepID=A0A2T7NF50_POMCA|nr:hypothetical protein C0Q70_20289 [Pomacea canaliculata]